MTMRQRIAKLIQLGHLTPEVWIPVIREGSPELALPAPRASERSLGCREWFETYGDDGRMVQGIPY